VLKNTVDRGESPVKKSVAFLLKHGLTAALVIALVQTGVAQPPGPGPGGRGAGSGNAPRMPMTIAPDPRVEQVTYRFEDTGEDLAYVRYVSSKVSKDEKAPLIVALHGLGGDGKMKAMGLESRYVELAGGDHGTVIGDGMLDIFEFFAAHTKD
jgi:hypothetical protein